MLGLPPQASAKEIELAYVERRAEAAKRLQKGDPRARAGIEQLDRVIEQLENGDFDESPPPAREERPDSKLAHELLSTPIRHPARVWEATASLVFGSLACVAGAMLYSVLFFDADVGVGFPLDNPFFYLVFAFALAAETLAQSELRVVKHNSLLLGRGYQLQLEPDPGRVQRARLGRNLGRTAAALSLLFLVLIVVSFFRAIGAGS